jgi:hypothetical protein
MTDTPPILYCAEHPDTETTLRCNRCDKPICPKCAILTPTGYRCKDCVRGQQKIFETALWYDYVLIFVVVGFLSFLGSLVVGYVGFFTLFLAPVIGVVIAEIARWVIRRRRSRRLFQMAAVAAVLGSLPALLMLILNILLAGSGSIGSLLSLLWQVLYVVTLTSTIYYRLSGIQIK